jgi:hypothetical protein
MPDITSPGGIVYPIASDPIAPLNGVFQDMAESTQVAIGRADLTTAAYRYVDTVYYTSSGTFTKATYPWLRAIRVRCVGGGGGGGGCVATTATQNSIGQSGSGAVYAESFLTDIAGLDASITVTRGGGGAGGAAGANNGANGSSSSFGALVSAGGGVLGEGLAAATPPTVFGGVDGATTGTGDLVIGGGSSDAAFAVTASRCATGKSGTTVLGTGGVQRFSTTGGNGFAGNLYGEGGGGGLNAASQASSRSGGAGADGIVIVELYA